MRAGNTVAPPLTSKVCPEGRKHGKPRGNAAPIDHDREQVLPEQRGPASGEIDRDAPADGEQHVVAIEKPQLGIAREILHEREVRAAFARREEEKWDAEDSVPPGNGSDDF